MRISLLISIFLNYFSYYTTNAVYCTNSSKDLSCLFNSTIQTIKNTNFVSANLHGSIGDHFFTIFNTITYSIKYDIPFIFHPVSSHRRDTHNSVHLINYNNMIITNQSKTHDNKVLSLTWFEKENIFHSIHCITTLSYTHMNSILTALPTHRLTHTDFRDQSIINETSPVRIMTPHRIIIGNYQSYKHFDPYKQTIFTLLNLEKTRTLVYTKYGQNYDLNKKITIGINFMSILQNHTQVSIPYRYYQLAITDAINKRK